MIPINYDKLTKKQDEPGETLFFVGESLHYRRQIFDSESPGLIRTEALSAPGPLCGGRAVLFHCHHCAGATWR